MMCTLTRIVLSSVLPVLLLHGITSAQSPEFQDLLRQGKTKQAAAAMSQMLKTHPDNSKAGFQLGIAQFLMAIEELGQSQFRYGLFGGRRIMLPLTRLPVPENMSPEQLSWEATRDMIRRFREAVVLAETTLKQVKPDGVQVVVDLADIHLDLNGDGQTAPEESLLFIFNAVSQRQSPVLASEKTSTVIAFDDGDVLWLRGYCNILAATCEIALAYDWKDLFERTGHLFYPRIETPYQFLVSEGSGPIAGFHAGNLLDLVAFIHGINFQLLDAEGMKRALAHLEAIPELSRQSWKLINAETDNDREWLPNPQQTTAFNAAFRITPTMQTQWLRLMDEMDQILLGKRLLPFWRGIPGGISPFGSSLPTNPKLGINLRKVFTEPKPLDLVLCIQGTGLQPFLENGPQTDLRTWQEISQAFQGQFLIFALWLN